MISLVNSTKHSRSYRKLFRYWKKRVSLPSKFYNTSIVLNQRKTETLPIPLMNTYAIFKKYLFIYLAVPGLSCSMQDLQLWHVGYFQLRHAGSSSLNHWTTMEVPRCKYFNKRKVNQIQHCMKRIIHHYQVDFPHSGKLV